MLFLVFSFISVFVISFAICRKREEKKKKKRKRKKIKKKGKQICFSNSLSLQGLLLKGARKGRRKAKKIDSDLPHSVKGRTGAIP